MAKLLCLVAILLVASALVVEAKKEAKPAAAPAPTTAAPVPAPAPAPTTATPVPAPAPSSSIKKPATFLLKCIINNLASKEVTLKLLIRGKAAAKPVVAKTKTWTAIGPVKVECKVPLVVLYVSVKNHKGVVVKKSFPVKLAAVLKTITANSSKYFVLTVTEVKSWTGATKLLVKIGKKVQLQIKL